jgi:hypothetical protein
VRELVALLATSDWFCARSSRSRLLVLPSSAINSRMRWSAASDTRYQSWRSPSALVRPDAPMPTPFTCPPSETGLPIACACDAESLRSYAASGSLVSESIALLALARIVPETV